MNPSDVKFFEEYKELDNFLAKRLGNRAGVSEYIKRMEEKTPAGKRKVPTWEEDYKKVKHLRWVRNKIAHEAGKDPVAAKGDLEALRAFSKLVRSSRDPLSMLGGRKSAKKGGIVPFIIIALALIAACAYFIFNKK